jgi:hypothetical protein
MYAGRSLFSASMAPMQEAPLSACLSEGASFSTLQQRIGEKTLPGVFPGVGSFLPKAFADVFGPGSGGGAAAVG